MVAGCVACSGMILGKRTLSVSVEDSARFEPSSVRLPMDASVWDVYVCTGSLALKKADVVTDLREYCAGLGVRAVRMAGILWPI